MVVKASMIKNTNISKTGGDMLQEKKDEFEFPNCVSSEELEKSISEKSILIAIFFFARWASICKHVAATFITVSDKHKEKMQLYSVDVDSEQYYFIMEKCEIRIVPTVVFFKDKIAIKKIGGHKSSIDFKRIVEEILDD